LRAVRLPKEVAFPGSAKDVDVILDDAKRVITPANAVLGRSLRCARRGHAAARGAAHWIV